MVQARRSRVRDAMRLIHFFNLLNPSGCTRPSGLLTEMSTRSRKIMFLGSRARLVHRADKLTATCELSV
jgi:hypothetical protein